MKVSIIGCGHMGSAIAKALLKNNDVKVTASNLFKPTIKTGESFKWVTDNKIAAANAGVILIAVRPNVVEAALKEIRLALQKDQIIISIAAGVPLKKLQKWSGGHKKIVRVMPNLPAQVGQGMSIWIAGKSLSQKEKLTVAKLLGAFGKAIEVKNENMINMATAVCGGGPAYTAAFLESMAHALQKQGFNEKDARAAALQTVLGSAKYIEKTGVEFSTLKKAVQTKGGTTEAGFKVLKKKKWQAALAQAFEAGRKRAEKLS